MNYKKLAKAEIDKNMYLLDPITNSTLKTRIAEELEWFIIASVKAKHWFYFFSVITILSPLLSAVLLDFQETTNVILKVLISSLSVLSSASAALLNLFNCKNNWGLYRRQAENIKVFLSTYANDKISEEELFQMVEHDVLQTNSKFHKKLNNNTTNSSN